MKIFISLPFTGKEDTLFERLNDAKQWVKDNYPTAEIITQSNIDIIASEQKSVADEQFPFYMGQDIQYILESDAILMCEGWESSRGCQLEYRAAELFDVYIIFKK